MHQDIAQPALHDRQRGRRHLAGAAKLRPQRQLARPLHPTHQRAVRPGPVAAARHVSQRRAECLQQRQMLSMALGVGALLDQRAGHIHQRRPAGMQVAHHIGQRDQHVLDEEGDLLRHRPVGIAGEAAIQIALVDRRCPGARHCRRKIRHRQQDHPPLYPRRVQRLGQVAQRHLPLILVAMVARHEQGRRANAVFDHHDRDRDEAVSRAMDGVKQSDEPGLPPLRIEVDLGDQARAGGFGHSRTPLTKKECSFLKKRTKKLLSIRTEA